MSQKNSLNRLRTLAGWRSPLIAMAAVLALALSGIGISAANADDPPAALTGGVELVLTRTSQPAPTKAGDVITFSWTLKDTYRKSDGAKVAINGLKWTPTNLAIVSCGKGDLAGYDPIIANTTRNCTGTYTVTAADVLATKVDVKVELKATPQADGWGQTTYSASLSLPFASPALSIDGSSSTITPVLDQPETYIAHDRLTVTNTGGPRLDAVGVAVSPADSGVSILCDTSSLPAKNDIATCTATYTVTQTEVNAGKATRSFTASSTQTGSSSAFPVETGITSTAHLSLTKTLSSIVPTSAGQNLTWTVIAKNDGTRDLTDVNVTDAAASLALTNGMKLDGCKSDLLAPNARIECTATKTLELPNFNAGGYSNTASASWKDSAPGFAAGSISSIPVETDLTRIASLKVTQTLPGKAGELRVGDPIRRTVTVTNDGNVTLGKVALSDTAMDTYTECTGSGWNSSIAPGEEFVCTDAHHVTQGEINAGIFENKVTATAKSTLTHSYKSAENLEQLNAKASDTDNSAIDRAPALSLSLQATGTAVKAGDPITYTATFTNTGNVTLGSFKLADELNAFTNVTCADLSSSLLPGAAGTCEVTYNVSQDQVDDLDVLHDTAHIVGSPVVDPVIVGNASDDSEKTDSDIKGTAFLNVVTTQTSANPRKEGATITWSVLAINNGTRRVKDLVILDSSASISCPDQTVIEPDKYVTCTATHKLTDKEYEANYFVNSARATSTTRGIAYTANAVNTVFGGPANFIGQNRTLTLASLASSPQLTTKAASFKATPSVTGGEIRYVVRSNSTTGCIIDNNTVIARSAGTCVIGATIEPYRTLTSSVAEDISITFVAPAPVVKAPVSIRSISSGRDR
jgi:uncharacterized repeat protein (TIGR01451 family)